MRERGMSRGQILDILEKRNHAYGHERLSMSDILTIVDSQVQGPQGI